MKTTRRKLFGFLGGALALPFLTPSKPVEAKPPIRGDIRIYKDTKPFDGPIKYKGKTAIDVGYYYCPYVPLYV